MLQQRQNNPGLTAMFLRALELFPQVVYIWMRLQLLVLNGKLEVKLVELANSSHTGRQPAVLETDAYKLLSFYAGLGLNKITSADLSFIHQ